MFLKEVVFIRLKYLCIFLCMKSYFSRSDMRNAIFISLNIYVGVLP